jgi:hypothetical protein
MSRVQYELDARNQWSSPLDHGRCVWVQSISSTCLGDPAKEFLDKLPTLVESFMRSRAVESGTRRVQAGNVSRETYACWWVCPSERFT